METPYSKDGMVRTKRAKSKRTMITIPWDLWDELNRIIEDVQKETHGAVNLSVSEVLRMGAGELIQKYKKTGKL